MVCELILSSPVSQHPVGPQEMLANGAGQKKGRNGLCHLEKVDLPFVESEPIASVRSLSGTRLIAKGRGEKGCSHAFPGVQKLRLKILICLGRNKCKMSAGKICWVRASIWDCKSVVRTEAVTRKGRCPTLGLK